MFKYKIYLRDNGFIYGSKWCYQVAAPPRTVPRAHHWTVRLILKFRNTEDSSARREIAIRRCALTVRWTLISSSSVDHLLDPPVEYESDARLKSYTISTSMAEPPKRQNWFLSALTSTTTASVVDRLLHFGVITPEYTCDRGHCGKQASIKITKRNGGEKGEYRCTCGFRRSVLAGSIFEGSKLTYSQLWGAVSIYALRLPGSASELYDFSEETMSRFRQEFDSCARDILEAPRYQMIGGQGVRVQADETMLIGGQKGPCKKIPSLEPDEYPGAIWVVGAVEEGDTRQAWAEVVPDRSAVTMTALFRRHVRVGSILVTDGHRSYPQVAEDMGLQHIAVVHADNIVDEDGNNTNSIESLWSLMGAMNTGVTRDNAALFVSRVIFNKRFLPRKGCKEAGVKLLLSKVFDI